jgi:hypothetical protein
VSEQFSVALFFDDGQHKYARRFVSAQEACRAFQHYSRSAGAQLGLTVRVIITDSSDCIVREWSVTLSRDYLDENGGGQSEFEAAAGSEVMIGLGPEVRKHFFWVSVFDCR